MATWSVKPTWKKSIIERNYLTKDGNKVMIETGWRWGEFTVETDDDNPPNIESGVDIYDCGYESELVETSDGCWKKLTRMIVMTKLQPGLKNSLKKVTVGLTQKKTAGVRTSVK